MIVKPDLYASNTFKKIPKVQIHSCVFKSSLMECGPSGLIDGPGTGLSDDGPCGGLQCIDGLHCCSLATGCKQCCKDSHCGRWQRCK